MGSGLDELSSSAHGLAVLPRVRFERDASLNGCLPRHRSLWQRLFKPRSVLLMVNSADAPEQIGFSVCVWFVVVRLRFV